MDLNDTFLECVVHASPAGLVYRPQLSSSLFIIKAEALQCSLRQLSAFCQDKFDEYSSYHHDMLGFRPTVDLAAFDDSISRLIVDFAVEIKDLQGMKSSASINEHRDSHRAAIVSSLLELLQSTSREFDNMKLERRKYGLNHFRILTEMSSASVSAKIAVEPTRRGAGDKSCSGAERMKFSERYTSDIAAPKQMKQYQIFFEARKELFANENKDLREKFSEELHEAESIEQSVQSIATLLSDFSAILEKQSDSMDDVLVDSKTTSAFVSGADEQLRLTIDRSKSSQRSMVIVTIGLSILLLLLDYLSP